MATNKVVLHIETRVAWWLPLYLDLVHGFALMFDVEPNWDMVSRAMARGVRTYVRIID